MNGILYWEHFVANSYFIPCLYNTHIDCVYMDKGKLGVSLISFSEEKKFLKKEIDINWRICVYMTTKMIGS